MGVYACKSEWMGGRVSIYICVCVCVRVCACESVCVCVCRGKYNLSQIIS